MALNGVGNLFSLFPHFLDLKQFHLAYSLKKKKQMIISTDRLSNTIQRCNQNALQTEESLFDLKRDI